MRRSNAWLDPCPGIAASISRAESALPGCGPVPAVFPTLPVPDNEVAPANGCAPEPSTPEAGRGSRCRKIRWAVYKTQAYGGAVLPPTRLGTPAAPRPALRPALTLTR